MQLRQQSALWTAQIRQMRGLDGTAFWLAVWFVLLWLVRLLPGTVGTLAAVLQVLVGLVLAVVAVPVLWRQVRRKLLWSLRSKLVLTYLLIGLAPVVLFVTLVLLSAYIAAGQFAIHLADTRLQSELDRLTAWNATDARSLREAAGAAPGAVPAVNGAELKGVLAQWRAPSPPPDAVFKPHLGAFLDGTEVALLRQDREETSPFGTPPWAMRLEDERFRGLVLDGGQLYLVAMREIDLRDGRKLSLLSSVMLNDGLMSRVAGSLGRARLIGAMTGSVSAEPPAKTAPVDKRLGELASKQVETLSQGEILRRTVKGGIEPPAANVLDLRVRFVSTLPVTDWDTGLIDNAPIEVISRPSRLYRELFGASLAGRVTRALQIGLVLLCATFALIELLALWMAARLSKTVTASVTDLYEATQRIDRGEFGFRIGVTRDDQLADLSRSFNSMTGSLQRLLLEQKEKERLQNEISIAQEVQANLFPLKVSDLPTLELHGVCRPARSVSGDYYDFLVFEQERAISDDRDRVTGVGIALGDISGKGISAALLMATLHSAVRAYRLASEELVLVGGTGAAMFSRTEQAGCSELFESPGRILALLNRHLYRSTQPEKYATLFLAHYDADSARLTYSNAGQLPPLVLGRDGAVRRLDRGGTVVGLLDGMEYEEDSFQMTPGDIMVAYSDGVTEPENDFGDFGEERLMEVVRRYRDEPLHVISSEVMQALDAWIGAEEQPDDITLVLARQI